MFAYYFRLAWLSIRKTPVMSALMVLAIAVGVGVAMTTLTLQYMMSKNPLSDKNGVLYAVQLDAWGPDNPYSNTANQLPDLLTYQDATALLRSDIPVRQAAMHRFGGAVQVPNSDIPAYLADARVTGRDFFGLFKVPFLFGGPWSKDADTQPTFQVVLGKALNDRLFHGDNSVGRTMLMDGKPFTVVGVIDNWEMTPKVYDVSNGALNDVEEMYMPFGLHRTLKIDTWGNTNGWKHEDLNTYEGFLGSELAWLEFWVELPDAEAKARYEQFLTAYIAQQKAHGRFPSKRTPSFALSHPDEWMKINQVVSNDSRALSLLSLAFLLVCVINTVALLLAKFLRKAPEAGVRRALGASRGAIFAQHLIESGCIGLMGGVLGIGLTLLGLTSLDHLIPGQVDKVARMDWVMLLAAVGLAILASLLAGLYPAWRVGRTNPAYYLKTQ
ncbi:ABC transporter permease [Gallaecimonas kandeliae]|uniref:ABC transporter permease n=1 Tax=Gallaecimonas kandeliae TaxID=3029055 RepID=UPI002647FD57|nr:ABC transporter permease [Gallaecimonas kandeliae]WKE65419.1 ABC transporter permease [Gallaecimonas kandeliae]